MIFTLSSVPQTTGMAGLAVAAYVRFISLLNVGVGFYNLQLYYNQLFKQSFLVHITNVDNPAAERIAAYKQAFLAKGMNIGQAESLANLNLSKVIALQTQLLTMRAIFLLLSYIVVIILVVLSVLVCITILKKRYTTAQSIVNRRFLREVSSWQSKIIISLLIYFMYKNGRSTTGGKHYDFKPFYLTFDKLKFIIET